jgi:hypothetical protein
MSCALIGSHEEKKGNRKPWTSNAMLAEKIAMGLILMILIILLLVGGLPAWPYSRRWGYGPSGALGTVLLILLVLILLDYVPRGF